MELFKSIDDKFSDLGFEKSFESETCVRYIRMNNRFCYPQVIDIIHKKNGRHIIQSYDEGLMDEKKIGNVCVGLTYNEMRLIMKKMKKKGWTGK